MPATLSYGDGRIAQSEGTGLVHWTGVDQLSVRANQWFSKHL